MRYVIVNDKGRWKLVDATRCAGSENTICDLCRKGVVWVRGSKRNQSYFRHASKTSCLRQHIQDDVLVEKPKESSCSMGDWHKSWSQAVDPVFRESET